MNTRNVQTKKKRGYCRAPHPSRLGQCGRVEGHDGPHLLMGGLETWQERDREGPRQFGGAPSRDPVSQQEQE